MRRWLKYLFHSFNESYIKIFEEKWMPKRERRGRNDQTHETGHWKGMKEFEVYTKTKTIENIIYVWWHGQSHEMDHGQTSKTDIKRDLYIFIKNDLKQPKEVKLLGKCLLHMSFHNFLIRTNYVWIIFGKLLLAQGNTKIALCFKFWQTSSSIQYLRVQLDTRSWRAS